jgi:hypothetical protein
MMMMIIQINSTYLHANLTAKGQLQSEHGKKIQKVNTQ